MSVYSGYVMASPGIIWPGPKPNIGTSIVTVDGYPLHIMGILGDARIDWGEYSPQSTVLAYSLLVAEIGQFRGAATAEAWALAKAPAFMRQVVSKFARPTHAGKTAEWTITSEEILTWLKGYDLALYQRVIHR